jgi:hypothetical protein
LVEYSIEYDSALATLFHFSITEVLDAAAQYVILPGAEGTDDALDE